MSKITVSSILIAAMVTVALSAGPAAAQRVFVAASGSDTNPCTFALPCRTFQHAHDTAAAGGEIDVLDPAGYGPLIIGKAISIQGHGFSGISVASGGTGITINASAGDVVNLNGLLIDGAGAGLNGILFNTGKFLAIENCIIRNFTQDALRLFPHAASSFAVADTFLDDNADAGVFLLQFGSSTVTAVFSRVQANDNMNGMVINGSSSAGAVLDATIVDSVASGNSNVDIGLAAQPSGGTSNLMVLRSVAANAGLGGLAAQGANATLRVGQSAVTGNANGWGVSSGGTLLSYGDNKIDGNAANEAAPPAALNK